MAISCSSALFVCDTLSSEVWTKHLRNNTVEEGLDLLVYNARLLLVQVSEAQPFTTSNHVQSEKQPPSSGNPLIHLLYIMGENCLLL